MRAGDAVTAGQRRRRLAFSLLLLLLLLVASPCARADDPEAAATTTQRGALTAQGVDGLINRFADLVVTAAGRGGGGGAASMADAADGPASPLKPALDPGVESLLARLLDEVLPSGDDDRDDLRRRTAGAMGLALPRNVDPPTEANANASAPSDRRRRRKLQQNATPLSPIVPPASLLTVNAGGLFGGYSQAFQLIFGNFFDFFLLGGLGFLVPVIGDFLAPLRRFNWVRDLGNAIDAPIDNIVNANYLPLPQTTDDLIALALRVLAPYCAAERAIAGVYTLGALRGAAAEVELVPWSCDVVPNEDGGGDDENDGDDDDQTKKDDDGKDDKHNEKKKRQNEASWRAARTRRLSGRQRIDWASCTPSKLVVRLKPATFVGPFFGPATYAAAACAFSQPFGFGSTVALGLDSAAVGFKFSRIGVDVVPTIVQFEGSGRFFPWLVALAANSDSGTPAREVTFTSASNGTTGAR